MTLLKFVIALLSTTVVAVDLSSKPDKSLTFAQLGEELSPEEEAFRSKVEKVSKEVEFIYRQMSVVEKPILDAYNKAHDN